MFWGDKPEDKARHSLREALRVLRQQLGDGVLQSDADQIGLVEEKVRLDVHDFAALEAAADWEGAAALVAGDFLEGLTVKGAWDFDEWLTAERASWRSRCTVALANRCEELLAAGRANEAVEAAMRASALDAASGIATRAAMKSLALTEDRTLALAQYDVYSERLAELGATPDTETQTLAEQVKRERTWQLPAAVVKRTEKGAASRRTPLIGREEELSRLVGDLEKCQAESRASVCLIEGDSGTGKTRLTEEILARARLSNATVAMFRATAGDVDLPGTGLLGLARNGLETGAGLAAASPKSLGAFAAEIPEWAD